MGLVIDERLGIDVEHRGEIRGHAAQLAAGISAVADDKRLATRCVRLDDAGAACRRAGAIGTYDAVPVRVLVAERR